MSVLEPPTSHFMCALRAVTSKVPRTVIPDVPLAIVYVTWIAGRPSASVIRAGVPPKVRCWPSAESLNMKWLSRTRSAPAPSRTRTLPSLRPTRVMPSASMVTGSAAYAGTVGNSAAPVATAVPWMNLRRATGMEVPFSWSGCSGCSGCSEAEGGVRGATVRPSVRAEVSP